MTQVHSASPQVGEQAPDFTLNDTNFKPVSLHDLRGKTVILAFFPAAFSSTCTLELCSFRDHLASLNEAKVEVVGISVDLPFSLQRFKVEQKLAFPLLSDFDRTAIQDYGVVDDKFKGYSSGVAQRSVFVVDPEGKITWQWISEHQGQVPEYGEVLRHVGAVDSE